MNCQDVQQDIATALLTGGALDAAVAEHVATCPSCAAEQASLRQVLAVMSTASERDVRLPVSPPADDLLLHRIIRAAADERAAERRRWSVGRLLVAAAVVVLLAAGVVLGAAVFMPDHVVTASASAAGLSATVDIAQADAGSELRVEVTGLPHDTDCVISVTTADGRTLPVVAWRSEYEGTARVAGMADADPTSITRVSLSEPNGKVLLDIPIAA